MPFKLRVSTKSSKSMFVIDGDNANIVCSNQSEGTDEFITC